MTRSVLGSAGSAPGAATPYRYARAAAGAGRALCSAVERVAALRREGVNLGLREMGLIPRDAPEATLTTIVFFAAVYLAAKALIALENLQQ